MGLSERQRDLLEAQAAGARSQEAERRHCESTGAAAASGTALSREEGEQQRLPGSTGLRAGDNSAAGNQQGGDRETPPPPPGPVPREQPPPLPRETTGYITARGEEETTNSQITRDGREA